jgi:hypothetical protein
MIIKLLLDVPEDEDPRVQRMAQETRHEELVALCESYEYPSAQIHPDGVELVPWNIEGLDLALSKNQRDGEIQMAVGGLALELIALERYWNTARPFNKIREALEAPDTTPWGRMCP